MLGLNVNIGWGVDLVLEIVRMARNKQWKRWNVYVCHSNPPPIVVIYQFHTHIYLLHIQVKQILMDDLPAFCKFRKAIMRMNLGGGEHRAFQHAKFLFKEIQITYVFIDWANLKHLTSGDDLSLVSDMIQYFNKRGYVPRSYDGKVLSTKKWQQWPNNIYWQKMWKWRIELTLVFFVIRYAYSNMLINMSISALRIS